jgi:peptide/nickel transport system substrate-binding protein
LIKNDAQESKTPKKERRTIMCKMFKTLTTVILVSIVVAMPLSLAQADSPTKGGTLRIGCVQPRHLNNAIQSGNATGVPATQLFAGLIELDDKWQPHPYLAKSWEMAADGLSWTFHLEEKAVFHDGKPITSEDVAFSLDIVKNNHPFGVAEFAAVDRVDTPDPHTAIIRLKQPHPALIPALSSILLPIIPKHVYGVGEIQTHPANTKPVGSGPFKLVEYKPGKHIIMERNENFFRPGKPYLDRLVFIIIDDASTRVLAIENGEVDYVPFSQIRVHDVPRLKKNPKLIVTDRGYEALGPTNYLEFNLRKAPVNDVRVRKAIAYAVDQNFIVDKLQLGVTKRLDGPLHSSSPWFSDESIVKYDIDLDKANKLLDEAGYPRKDDGMRFPLTLDYAPTFHPDSQKPVAEYLRPQLKKIGIDVKLRASADFPAYAKRISNWEYDFSMNAIWNYPDPVIGVHRAYLCSNIKKAMWTNTEGYCNPKVDEILNKASVEVDTEKRKTLYAEFQKILTDELPFMWTNEEVLITVYTPKVKNVPLSVWGGLAPYDNVYLAK